MRKHKMIVPDRLMAVGNHHLDNVIFPKRKKKRQPQSTKLRLMLERELGRCSERLEIVGFFLAVSSFLFFLNLVLMIVYP